VIFSQERPGRGGQIFRLHKFRTMKEFDANEELVTDEQRLTEFGRMLRSTSLDELPTLLNVLRGDMSFVGPRPLLPKYLDRYTPDQARRHDVRPGITGLAQVNGRNLLSWDDKFALDLRYIENRRLGLDLKILVATIGAVFSRSGISAPGEATASEFMGTDGIDLIK
jgi:lipopolysaccharide/colanic/teichoic acid biosynthesis glycosyltransferase